jgi:hypothetical protein
MRWFLGPGYLEMSRLSAVSFADSPFSQVFHEATRKRIGELNLAVDVDAFQELTPSGADIGLTGEGSAYMNAVNVEMYLREKGVQLIDEGEAGQVPLELHIPGRSPELGVQAWSTPSVGALREDQTQPSRRTRPWSFVNFDSFFMEDELNPGSEATHNTTNLVAERLFHPPQTLLVSQERLLWNLVDISVCLASGPGYQRAMIDQAIAASVLV